MTVTAVALIVDGGSLVAAYALLPHVVGTALSPAWLRLAFVRIARGQGGGGPFGDRRLLGIFRRESRQDRSALGVVRLGRDLNGRHP